MASGFPDWTTGAFTSAKNSELKQVSASDSETTTSFTNRIKSILIYNDGPNPVFVNFDATATTSSFKIPAKAWLNIDLEIQSLHSITATGETASLFVIGTY